MTPARIAIVLVALVAAVCLALFVHTVFVRPKPAPPPPVVAAAAPLAPAMTRVLVAKSDLSVGDRLAPGNMTWQPWPAATANAAYITDGVVAPASTGAAGAMQKVSTTVGDMTSGGGPKLQAMVGAIVREPIYAGQPITAKGIIRAGDSSYMAVRLPEGMRAIAVPVNVESGAGGFIQPGDRIDLLSTHSDSNGHGGGMITETVLSNVLVLAIDQKTDTPKNGGATMVGATLTLEVPAPSANAVAKARTQGGLTMALRSYADMSGKTVSKASDAQGEEVRIFRGGSAAETVSAP
jgi:pilus assembly protein CpaB